MASNTITVSGSLSTVRDTLLRLSETIKNREALGFNALVHEAEFMYITERDSRVCFFCRQYEHTIIRGDRIPQLFPLYRFLDDRHIAPEVHLQHSFLWGDCRCQLELENVGELCEGQLHKEKLSVL